ncbi:MAG: methylmalonyl-CoA epimerase [Candidatus Binataceae bacterium]
MAHARSTRASALPRCSRNGTRRSARIAWTARVPVSPSVLRRIHHVGVVVTKLDDALKFWRDALGLRVTRTATIEDQGVRAALLDAGNSEIELLEPIDPSGGVAKFLARRGGGLHHICFETEDVAAELDAARAKGIQLIDQQPRRGLAGMICFLHPKAARGVLVEYAQPIDAE